MSENPCTPDSDDARVDQMCAAAVTATALAILEVASGRITAQYGGGWRRLEAEIPATETLAGILDKLRGVGIVKVGEEALHGPAFDHHRVWVHLPGPMVAGRSL